MPLFLLLLLLVHSGNGCLPGNQVTVADTGDVNTGPDTSSNNNNGNAAEKDPGAGDINNGGGAVATQAPPIQTAGPVNNGGATAPPPVAAGGDTSFCTQIQCTFEQGNLCNYKTNGKQAIPEFPAPGARLKRQTAGQYNELSWVAHSGRFGNRNTGIAKAGDQGQQYFGGAYLEHPGDIAVLTADLATPLAAPQSVTFDYYENTQDLVLKACCDANCNPISQPTAAADKRVWQQSTLPCPAGTKQVSFRCENSGKETGACGVDNIKVATCPPS